MVRPASNNAELSEQYLRFRQSDELRRREWIRRKRTERRAAARMRQRSREQRERAPVPPASHTPHSSHVPCAPPLGSSNAFTGPVIEEIVCDGETVPPGSSLSSAYPGEQVANTVA